MAVTNYYTVDGQILGEATGGVRTDYLTDALGSVTATVDQGSAVLNTYRHKPYGGLLAKTGNSPDPKFLWTGNTGSRKTGLAFSDQYNQARHYGTSQGQWTTVDHIWPYEPPYEFCRSSPGTRTDPTGLRVEVGKSCGGKLSELGKCCEKLNSLFDNGEPRNDVVDDIAECMSKKHPVSVDFIKKWLKYIKDRCSGGEKKICVECVGGLNLPPNCDPCKNSSTIARTIWPEDIPLPFPLPEGCPWIYPRPEEPCAPLRAPGCDCSIVVCQVGPNLEQQCVMLFHELIHCAGVGSPPGHNIFPSKDVIFALGCCLCEKMNGKGSPDCFECEGWR